MKKKAAAPVTPDNLDLISIMEHFSTDEKARTYLESIRWPDGKPVCPHCGAKHPGGYIQSAEGSSTRPYLYHCAGCREQFTVTVGTIFEKSKIPLRKWLVAWYLLCASKKGMSAHQMYRQLGLGSYRTAWFMMHRIRYALSDPAFAGKLGGNGGTVEADETWIGGKAKGKGRGYVDNKVPVVALVERNGDVRSMPVERVTGENLERILNAHVDKSATIMTDESMVYPTPCKAFAAHHTVNHKAGEYVRGNVTTNGVEGYFANLKRGITGIYHHVGSHYLDQYLAEFDYRFNTRRDRDGSRTVAGIRKIEGKRLMLRPPAKQ